MWDTCGSDISRFIRGKVDIWTGYVHDEPIEVEMAGYNQNSMYLFDYGLEDYAGLLVTRKEFAENRPDLVLAFLAASIGGWDFALRNPEDAIDAVLDFAPGLSVPFQRKAIHRLIPFVNSGDAPIGWIDQNRFANSIVQWGIDNPLVLLDCSYLHQLYGEVKVTENVIVD